MSDLQHLRFQLLVIRMLQEAGNPAYADAEKFIAETEATIAAWYPPPEQAKPGIPDPHKFP